MRYQYQRATNAIQLLEKEIKKDKAEINHLQEMGKHTPDVETSLEMFLFRVRVLDGELRRLKKLVSA